MAAFVSIHSRWWCEINENTSVMVIFKFKIFYILLLEYLFIFIVCTSSIWDNNRFLNCLFENKLSVSVQNERKRNDWQGIVMVNENGKSKEKIWRDFSKFEFFLQKFFVLKMEGNWERDILSGSKWMNIWWSSGKYNEKQGRVNIILMSF